MTSPAHRGDQQKLEVDIDLCASENVRRSLREISRAHFIFFFFVKFTCRFATRSRTDRCRQQVPMAIISGLFLIAHCTNRSHLGRQSNTMTESS